MNVLKYLNFVAYSKFNLGEKLGSGADGEVYEFDYKTVVKFSLINKYNCLPSKLKITYESAIKTIDYLCNHPSDVFAKVYDYGELSTSENYIYYTVMERLQPLSKVDYSTLTNVIYPKKETGGIDYLENQYFNQISTDQVSKILTSLECNKNLAGRIRYFHRHLQLNKVEHKDINIHNILKCNKGYFKLIDFDRCLIKGE